MSGARTKKPAPRKKPRPMKRSVEWWTWEEYAAKAEGAAEALARYRDQGWGPAGRVSLTIFVDGSAQLAIPLRTGRTFMTRLFDFPAEDLRGTR